MIKPILITELAFTFFFFTNLCVFKYALFIICCLCMVMVSFYLFIYIFFNQGDMRN